MVDMEKRYKINHYSTLRFTLPFFAPFGFLFLICLPLSIMGFIGNEVILVVLAIWLLGIALTFIPFIPKPYAKSVYQARIDTDRVVFECIKPCLWSKSKPALQVNFNELKSYDFDKNLFFDVLKLKLQSGKKLLFQRQVSDKNEDLEIFVRNFKEAVEQYNQAHSVSKPIEKGKTLMDNKIFLWILAVVFGLIIAVGIVLLIVTETNRNQLIRFLIVIAPSVWVFNQVVKGLKKKSE